MKKYILLFLTSLVFFMVADGHAQNESIVNSCCYEDTCCDGKNYHAKILCGVNFLQNMEIRENKYTYQTGYIIAGSLNYGWRYGLRLEAEYAFRRNAVNKIYLFGEAFSKYGHVQTSSYMANLLWDVPFSLCGNSFWNIQPFIGGGIGYDFQQMHSSNSSISFHRKWNHFSWQVITGLVFPIFCNTDITLEYKFHQGGCHFNNNTVGVGFVYKFSGLR